MDQENMGWVPSMVKGPPVPLPSILEGVFRSLGGLRFFLGKIFKFWKNYRLLEDFFQVVFKKISRFWKIFRILGNSQVILGDFKNFRFLRILWNFQIFRNLRGSSGFFLKDFNFFLDNHDTIDI